MLRKAFTTVGAPNLCRAMASAAAPTKLEGKVVLITAATQGLGLAAARRVAQEGAKVMICSRKQANVDEALEQLHKEGLTNIHGIQCHVSDEQQRKNLIDETIKKFGGIDSLVHCAGISPCPGPVLAHTSTAFDKIVEVNLKSAFDFAKLVRPHMNARNGGTMIFLSSTGAYQTTPAMFGLYAVVKLALIGFTKEVAKEVANENIRVNCIVAGTFNTKYSSVFKTEEFGGAVFPSILMKRLGEPEEMSGAVSFLVSEDSSYMTGEALNMSGGVPSRI